MVVMVGVLCMVVIGFGLAGIGGGGVLLGKGDGGDAGVGGDGGDVSSQGIWFGMEEMGVGLWEDGRQSHCREQWLGGRCLERVV